VARPTSPAGRCRGATAPVPSRAAPTRAATRARLPAGVISGSIVITCNKSCSLPLAGKGWGFFPPTPTLPRQGEGAKQAINTIWGRVCRGSPSCLLVPSGGTPPPPPEDRPPAHFSRRGLFAGGDARPGPSYTHTA